MASSYQSMRRLYRLFYRFLEFMKITWRVWKIYFQNRIATNNIYRFSPLDRNLHKRELLWNLPDLSIIHSGSELELLEIQGRRFYWPLTFSKSGLPWLYAEIFYPREKNPSSYEHPLLSLHKASWVIDAGVCEGFFSMYALENGAKKVLGIEPLPALKLALEKTFAGEIKGERFQLVSAGLGKENGMMELQADPLHVWGASLRESKEGRHEIVTVTTIDSLCQEYHLEQKGFLKMDIEGAEMDALLGAQQTFKHLKPKLAIACYHGYENALRCKEIIHEANPSYQTEFRGMYGYFLPPRPYLLFGW